MISLIHVWAHVVFGFEPIEQFQLKTVTTLDVSRSTIVEFYDPKEDEDTKLVNAWLQRQPTEWRHVEQNCEQLAVMFTDETWLQLTTQAVKEIADRRTCVALWLWLQHNTSSIALCDTMPCFVDSRCSGVASKWGSATYFNKIVHRMPIMAALMNRLPLHKRRGIALLDSDVAFLRKQPLVRFEHMNTSVVVQQEWPCVTAPLRLCVNGGVWWMRRTEENRVLLTRVLASMRGLGLPDQDALDLALHEVPSVHYLDRLKYANAYVAMHDERWKRNAAHLVHANIALAALSEKEGMLGVVRQCA